MHAGSACERLTDSHNLAASITRAGDLGLIASERGEVAAVVSPGAASHLYNGAGRTAEYQFISGLLRGPTTAENMKVRKSYSVLHVH